jgi:hypothetical protein
MDTYSKFYITLDSYWNILNMHDILPQVKSLQGNFHQTVHSGLPTPVAVWSLRLRFLRPGFRILLRACMLFSCVGNGLCDELITHAEEPHRVCVCVCVCARV